jgi:hypothetical protein
MQKKEFQEIGHTGGKVTFNVVTDPQGRRQYQVGWTHQSPRPAALFAVWALRQGVAVAGINLGGIGTPWNDPPVPGCFPVFIGSDSEGKFGHQCHACRGYWRSAGTSVMCPYCASGGDRHLFLTEAQEHYVAQYCERLNEALADEKDGEHVIDMDAVAAAVGKDSEKPPFYYAEESQQKSFTCPACGAFNDIIGRFCYCSACGTRNDLHELETDVLQKLHARANAGGGYESCVADAVGAFDTFVGQYAKELTRRVPLRSARKNRLERTRFHDLQAAAAELKAGFDIDILDGLKPDDVAFATLMFHRRHVYEHNGSVVDEKYLKDSGDTTVRLRQEIRESQTSAHRIIGLVAKMAENLHNGFHDIFPPEAEPVRRYSERMKRQRSQMGRAHRAAVDTRTGQ